MNGVIAGILARKETFSAYLPLFSIEIVQFECSVTNQNQVIKRCVQREESQNVKLPIIESPNAIGIGRNTKQSAET